MHKPDHGLTGCHIRRILTTIKPEALPILVLAVLIVLDSLLGVVPAILYQRIIDDALALHNAARLWFLCIVTLGAGILSTFIEFSVHWGTTALSQRQLTRFRVEVFSKMRRLPYHYYKTTPAGITVSRMTNDLAEAQSLATSVLPHVIGIVASIFATGSVMFSISWQTTLIILILAPLLLIPAEYLSRRLHALSINRMDSFAGFLQFVQERASAPGAMLSRLYADPGKEQQLFAAEVEKNRRGWMSIFMVNGLFGSAMSLIGAAGLVVVYLVGGLQVLHGTLSVGGLIAIASLVMRLYGPIQSISGLRLAFASASAGFTRFFEFIDLPEAWHETGNNISGMRNASLAVKHLTYTIKEDDKTATILDDVSFTVRSGEIVAVIGASGSGKSTLLSAITGLIHPTFGQIELNGVSVDTISTAEHCGSIGLLAQDSHFFHTSLRDNFTLVRPNVTEQEIEHACRQANIWSIVSSLDQGLDTILGDHGLRLSGGERARLALARLLIKNPRILLLDEPTAHLDMESEKLFMETLRSISQGRTILLVTHQREMIRFSDRVIEMADGRIINEITHKTFQKEFATLELTGMEVA